MRSQALTARASFRQTTNLLLLGKLCVSCSLARMLWDKGVGEFVRQYNSSNRRADNFAHSRWRSRPWQSGCDRRSNVTWVAGGGAY